MIIGVLGIQGNLEEHEAALVRAMSSLSTEMEIIRVKSKEDLDLTDALLISGGESTTIWKLLREYGLFSELKKYEKPIFGTCAGLILLAKDGTDKDSKKTGQEFLGKIDATVNRNAFGRQVDSFSTQLKFDGKEIEAVFIRAPSIEKVGKGVEVLSKYKGKIVAARQDNVLVIAFHPELTDDTTVHEYFLKMAGLSLLGPVLPSNHDVPKFDLKKKK
jgi:5'-phosphate synthase pdxT subunit